MNANDTHNQSQMSSPNSGSTNAMECHKMLVRNREVNPCYTPSSTPLSGGHNLVSPGSGNSQPLNSTPLNPSQRFQEVETKESSMKNENLSFGARSNSEEQPIQPIGPIRPANPLEDKEPLEGPLQNQSSKKTVRINPESQIVNIDTADIEAESSFSKRIQLERRNSTSKPKKSILKRGASSRSASLKRTVSEIVEQVDKAEIPKNDSSSVKKGAFAAALEPSHVVGPHQQSTFQTSTVMNHKQQKTGLSSAPEDLTNSLGVTKWTDKFRKENDKLTGRNRSSPKKSKISNKKYVGMAVEEEGVRTLNKKPEPFADDSPSQVFLAQSFNSEPKKTNSLTKIEGFDSLKSETVSSHVHMSPNLQPHPLSDPLFVVSEFPEGSSTFTEVQELPKSFVGSSKIRAQGIPFDPLKKSFALSPNTPLPAPRHLDPKASKLELIEGPPLYPPTILNEISCMLELSKAAEITLEEVQLKKYRPKTREAVQGPFSLSDGGCYKGQVKDNLMEGFGRYVSRLGDVYEGYFKGGLFHGEGWWVNNQGDIYQGSWSQSLREGLGLLQSLSGYLYRGQWVNDLPQGQGVERKQTGEVYKGGFKAGLWEGQGEEKGKDYVLKGEFKGGLVEGRGRRVRVCEGGIEDYDGEWAKGVYSGAGRLRDGRGEYVGEFHNGRRHGKGVQYVFHQEGSDSVVQSKNTPKRILESQTSQFDSLLDESSDGQNRPMFLEYKGEFKYNKYHGKGVLFSPDGTETPGQFRKGELITTNVKIS